MHLDLEWVLFFAHIEISRECSIVFIVWCRAIKIIWIYFCYNFSLVIIIHIQSSITPSIFTHYQYHHHSYHQSSLSRSSLIFLILINFMLMIFLSYLFTLFSCSFLINGSSMKQNISDFVSEIVGWKNLRENCTNFESNIFSYCR